MKKMMKVLVAITLTLGLLVACGGGSEKGSTIKMGVASTQEVNETRNADEDKVEFTTTVVGVALVDDKVAYISIDESQQFAEGDGTVTTMTAEVTKKLKGSDYGMKDFSTNVQEDGIGMEWDEQIIAVEENLVGKTLEEVKAYFAGEEILTSATIEVDHIEETVVKAISAATEVKDVAKVGLGYRVEVSVGKDENAPQSVLEYAMVAFDADGKIIEAQLDNAQEKAEYDAGAWTLVNLGKTKDELQEAYNMIVASPIEKEWFEQNDAFMEYVKGKTVEEVLAVEDPAEDEDLKTSVTMHIDGPQAAIKMASEVAKDVK